MANLTDAELSELERLAKRALAKDGSVNIVISGQYPWENSPTKAEAEYFRHALPNLSLRLIAEIQELRKKAEDTSDVKLSSKPVCVKQ